MNTYFEDLTVGQKWCFGHYEVTREEVLDFARRYDPQPFHLSDEAAAKVPAFGRLAASGWHTAGMAMSMTVREFERIGFASLGSPGLDSLRWPKPVYPGDVLRVESEIEELRPSKSMPHLGFARVRKTVLNQDDEVVMIEVANLMVARRPGGMA